VEILRFFPVPGSTISGGTTVSQHTEVHHEMHEGKEKKSLGEKIKSLF
jgi:hypothetical protein